MKLPTKIDVTIPMIYQICLLLFCSGVFLFGLAKLLEVFKP